MGEFGLGVRRDMNEVPVAKGHTPDPGDDDMYVVVGSSVREKDGVWEDVVALEQVCIFQDEEEAHAAGEPMHCLPVLRLAGRNLPGEDTVLEAVARHYGIPLYTDELYRNILEPPEGTYDPNAPEILALAARTDEVPDAPRKEGS